MIKPIAILCYTLHSIRTRLYGDGQTEREREIKEKGGIRREMNENKENKTTENNKSQSKTKAPKQLK